MNVSYKKLISIMLALTLMISLTGCGEKNDGETVKVIESQTEAEASKTADQSDDMIEISFWHLWPEGTGAQSEAVSKVIADFEAENPNIKIIADATENETYKTKIKTAIAAGEAPDLFFSWGAGWSKSFVESGMVLPLDDYIHDGTTDKLIGGALTNFTYDGKIYGLPLTLNVGIMYCNEELFEEHGIKIPETYSELKEAVIAFREKDIVPFAAGGKDRWPVMFYHNALALKIAGAEANNSALNKMESFDTPEIVDSAAKLKELYDLGAFDEGVLGLNRDESQEPFKAGEIPMYFHGSWFAGDLEKDGVPVKGKIKVVNFPIIEGANGDPNEFYGGAVDTFMVNSKVDNLDATIKFQKYLCEHLSKEFYLFGGGLPTWKVDYDTSDINPILNQITELLDDSTGFVVWWNTFLEGEDGENHMDLLLQAMVGDITPEEFAQGMQKMNE
ncbi:extracellular solute-binding protein [Vallitalea guaymasensis]|uniref:Extracellular solute-binding protein n=1 Tax=Vallitalea guaymasensis TaxID=1185412 RepID=A0A8J8SEK2_9FIRM|nr:extracellular solute-binding protein [Vallitalea guaymasensis]QUH31631.1 extracellular solute-binding protein [Vallitalea guaymasensis]